MRSNWRADRTQKDNLYSFHNPQINATGNEGAGVSSEAPLCVNSSLLTPNSEVVPDSKPDLFFVDVIELVMVAVSAEIEQT